MNRTAVRRPPITLLPSFAILATTALVLATTGGCSSGPAPAAEFVAQADALHQGALASACTADRDLTDYFAEMGKRIVQGATAADARYTRDPVFATMQFHLVGSPIPNAFTSGGRHIYVYGGLFQLCESEEELAAVMAQQFAHAVDLDVQQTGMKPDPKNTTDKIAYAFVQFPFLPEMRQQADARGFEFYARGGWDPARYPAVYQRLLARGLVSPGEVAAPGRVPLELRVVAAQRLAASVSSAARNWLKPPVADPESFRDLRGRAATGGEASSTQNRAWLYLRAFPNVLLPIDPPAQQAAQAQLRKDVIPPPPPTGALEPS